MGWFYIVQLLPQTAPHRVKLGWTTKPARRLQTFRTVCPNARLLRRWPCRSYDEFHVMSLLTEGFGHKSVGRSPEVFDCDHIDNLLARSDRLIHSWCGEVAARMVG